MPTWTATDGTWNTASNWTGNTVPNGIAAAAIFNLTTNGGFADVGILENSTIVVGTISYTATGTTGLSIFGQQGIGGSVATLVFNNNRNNARIDIDVAAGTAESSISQGLGSLNISLVSNLEINVVDSFHTLAISAPIGGNGGLIKLGEGTLRLFLTPNSFTGGIQLQGGTLEIDRDSRLGDGAITISNHAIFLASDENSGIVDQTITTVQNAGGIAGSAQIVTHTGSQVTLTGNFAHNGQGTMQFGNAANAGTIVASFGNVAVNATLNTYTIAAGTLRMGNVESATFLLRAGGLGHTNIYLGATLDTAGFATIINSLDMDGGTILSSSGALNVTVYDSQLSASGQAGTIQGTAGQDTFTVVAQNYFGLDTLTFANWTDAVDVIALYGSDNANSLRGSTHADTINGYGGDDDLFGSGGVDSLSGGVGDDVIWVETAGSGSSVHGGFDFDTLSTIGTVSLDQITGVERLYINSGTLTLTGTQVATGLAINTEVEGFGGLAVNMTAGTALVTKLYNFSGFGGTVTVTGTSGTDLIVLGNSTNAVSGGDGLDQIKGGSLVDTVNGGIGNDKIIGNGGADVLTGSTGNDVFKYKLASDSGIGAAADRITDFTIGQDRLNFVKIDANAALAGDQAFGFIGTAAFVNTGIGQIRYVVAGNDLRVEADVDGNGTADMNIILANIGDQSLSASDFAL
jgi:autotransporter-associated beta strand protein